MVRREARWARIRAERMSQSQSQSQSSVECRMSRNTSHVTRHAPSRLEHERRIASSIARRTAGDRPARRATPDLRRAACDTRRGAPMAATPRARRKRRRARSCNASAAGPCGAHRVPARATSGAPARRKPARRPRDAGAARAHGAGRCARVGKTLNLRSSGRSPMCRTTNASSLRSARRS